MFLAMNARDKRKTISDGRLGFQYLLNNVMLFLRNHEYLQMVFNNAKRISVHYDQSF